MTVITEKIVLKECLIMQNVTIIDILHKIENLLIPYGVIMVWAIEDVFDVFSINYAPMLTIDAVIEEIAHRAGCVYIRAERLGNSGKIYLYASFLKIAHHEDKTTL